MRYEVLWKKKQLFKIFSKIIYLFANNYFASLKVIPLRYDTVMKAFFPILETLLKRAFLLSPTPAFRIFCYLLNRGMFFYSPLILICSRQRKSCKTRLITGKLSFLHHSFLRWIYNNNVSKTVYNCKLFDDCFIYICMIFP